MRKVLLLVKKEDDPVPPSSNSTSKAPLPATSSSTVSHTPASSNYNVTNSNINANTGASNTSNINANISINTSTNANISIPYSASDHLSVILDIPSIYTEDIDNQIEVVLRFLSSANPEEYYDYIYNKIFKYSVREEIIPFPVLQKYAPLVKFMFFSRENSSRIAEDITRACLLYTSRCV